MMASFANAVARLRRVLEFSVDSDEFDEDANADAWVRPEKSLAGELAAASAAVLYVESPTVALSSRAGAVTVSGPLLAEVLPSDGGEVVVLAAGCATVELLIGSRAEELVGTAASTVRVCTRCGVATDVEWSAA